MSERWTVQRVVQWIASDLAPRGIDTARLDAELLVAHALKTNRVGLYVDLHRPLQPAELSAIRELVARRREREPVAYILGYREFYGRRFEVNPAVLIPRPETETLVDAALAKLKTITPNGTTENTGMRVLDLCSGSGAIGITIAAEQPGVRVDLVDVSPDAVQTSRRNADVLGVAERVRCVRGDVRELVAVPELEAHAYALIVCNPPYIPSAQWRELAPEIVRYEPALALDGGPDGLDFYRSLADGAPGLLVTGGQLLLEVGADQARAVAKLFATRGAVHFISDYHGVERVVVIDVATP